MTVSEVRVGNPAALHDPHTVQLRDEHHALHTFQKTTRPKASGEPHYWKHTWVRSWGGTVNPHKGGTCAVCGGWLPDGLLDRIRAGTPSVADCGLVAFLDEQLEEQR